MATIGNSFQISLLDINYLLVSILSFSDVVAQHEKTPEKKINWTVLYSLISARDMTNQGDFPRQVEFV